MFWISAFFKGLVRHKWVLVLKSGFFLIGFGLADFSKAGEEEKAHICFFELNNTTTSKNLKKKFGEQDPKCPRRKEYSNNNTVIHCYQPQQGNTGNYAFERMIQTMSSEGEHCDGLVISGHHTGDWYGETGKMYLKSIEALSCKKEYEDWFKNVKALWLDGCNTVTDNFIESTGIIKTADSESVRVAGKELTEQKLKKITPRIQNLQQSYTASLDENTPLSSRYLRMFPNTQIYGFNGAAPEGDPRKNNQVGSQSFIFQHLSLLGQAIDAESENSKNLSDFRKGLNALFFEDPCDGTEEWEQVSQQAEFSGVENQDYDEARRLGCDLTLAQQVLDKPKKSKSSVKNLAERIQKDPRYDNNTEAKHLANKLVKNPSDSEGAVRLAQLAIIQTLKDVGQADQDVGEVDKSYSHILFNSIYDTWNTAKKSKDSRFLDQVKLELKKESWTKSLTERITSPHTASLRKGDYIKFYSEIYGIKNPNNLPRFAQKGIQDLLTKVEGVFPDLQSPKNLNLDIRAKRALAVSVVDQLRQYGLLSEDQMTNLVKNKKLFPEETKNPFVADNSIRLQFAVDESQILPIIQQETNSAYRIGAVRVGTEIYLRQNKKPELEEIAQAIKLAEGQSIEPGDPAYELWMKLHKHLKNKGMIHYSRKQEKWQANSAGENFIYELTENSRHLGRIVLGYVDSNFSTQTKESLKNKMDERTHPAKKFL